MKNFKIIVIGFFSVLFILNCEYKTPILEYFPDMADSRAVESQEADVLSASILGGNRIPPEGTIPRGYYPYPYSNVQFADELKNPEKGLSNPLKKSLANYKRGEDRYQIYCSPCHGVTGQGNGNVVGPSPRYLMTPTPLTQERVVKFTDGQIYHVITVGKGVMSSYASQIEPEDRWKLIQYIRKLQEAENNKTKAVK
ncbi:MAG: cytochrome c [Leptospiraceae bacterium]|nr:cytochrome c [Leptospiraceae bacterium]MCK6380266.1 cytochrome c [Leptospiraceae bacterium]NUM41099.1 cytochrome c [Leptospiraceae bacterium]